MADTKTEEPSKVIEHMGNWVNSQPHLPKDIGLYLLSTFIESK